MPNSMVYGLTSPRTDTRIAASGQPEAFVTITATSTATLAPGTDTPYINTQSAETLRTFIKYGGTVASATLRMWILQDGDWYQAADTELTPANGSEVYDWDLIGQHTNVSFQVVAIAGGGTIQVAVLGVY